jgi:hypothetical protein
VTTRVRPAAFGAARGLAAPWAGVVRLAALVVFPLAFAALALAAAPAAALVAAAASSSPPASSAAPGRAAAGPVVVVVIAVLR